ncbi:short-chain dehydrogenase [Penicillium maclennaniae]|uniref:short-chain dehydrogenase n=1 Tax=Penicillium maclennaniae TaxID=1343394 RepID=UPI0025415EF7|nr:short-chain dehydrogenase [Penicillium maclennaniae]KAJ5677543.1 short-chain dehydrogenase [Penicillium maclennaniae]
MANFISQALWTQSFCIPSPPLTEKNLPDQKGRVHIVTGGYAGVGKELSAILYEKGATVYIAGRNEQKAEDAMRQIEEEYPSASGHLRFLLLDLNDLTSIKASAETFMAQESRLDVLVNNAGVMFPPEGSKTTQGHDLQFGTNMLGPFLFTKLLMPILVETAKTAVPGSVRVLWASSLGIQVLSPNGGGMVLDESGAPKVLDNQETNYGQTKVGNVFLAVKLQELYGSQGVRSVSFNPGNLKTELQRHSTGLMMKLADLMLHPAKFGAYTELYSGWSEEVGADKSITYVMPWGRDGTHIVRSDIQKAIENGLADKVWNWCESETKSYL